MPNQSDPNQNNPIGPVIPAAADLPPVPPEFQAASPTSTPNPTQETPGSAAPLNTPPAVSTPKKKFGGGRIIATILGILLLVGGVGAGIVLTQQPQLFQQKADYSPYEECLASGNTPIECSGLLNLCGTSACNNGEICSNGSCVPNPTTNTCGRDVDPGAPVCCTGGCTGTLVCEGSNRLECNTNGQHCTVDADGCTDGSPPPPEETPPPPGASAQCSNVKAYSSTWNPLTTTELTALAPDTEINFCVSGIESPQDSAGQFDKGRFKINDTVYPETTTKRPSSDDYCQNYIIKATDTTVTVKARIHHTILDWKGETLE